MAGGTTEFGTFGYDPDDLVGAGIGKTSRTRIDACIYIQEDSGSPCSARTHPPNVCAGGRKASAVYSEDWPASCFPRMSTWREFAVTQAAGFCDSYFSRHRLRPSGALLLRVVRASGFPPESQGVTRRRKALSTARVSAQARRLAVSGTMAPGSSSYLGHGGSWSRRGLQR